MSAVDMMGVNRRADKILASISPLAVTDYLKKRPRTAATVCPH